MEEKKKTPEVEAQEQKYYTNTIPTPKADILVIKILKALENENISAGLAKQILRMAIDRIEDISFIKTENE